MERTRKMFNFENFEKINWIKDFIIANIIDNDMDTEMNNFTLKIQRMKADIYEIIKDTKTGSNNLQYWRFWFIITSVIGNVFVGISVGMLITATLHHLVNLLNQIQN